MVKELKWTGSGDKIRDHKILNIERFKGAVSVILSPYEVKVLNSVNGSVCLLVLTLDVHIVDPMLTGKQKVLTLDVHIVDPMLTGKQKVLTKEFFSLARNANRVSDCQGSTSEWQNQES